MWLFSTVWVQRDMVVRTRPFPVTTSLLACRDIDEWTGVCGEAGGVRLSSTAGLSPRAQAVHAWQGSTPDDDHVLPATHATGVVGGSQYASIGGGGGGAGFRGYHCSCRGRT